MGDSYFVVAKCMEAKGSHGTLQESRRGYARITPVATSIVVPEIADDNPCFNHDVYPRDRLGFYDSTESSMRFATYKWTKQQVQQRQVDQGLLEMFMPSD